MTQQAQSPLSERLEATGPKRLLSLDGGGVRGLISLGYLANIELILRKRHKNDELVLSDYFDLIGGTSTGAIIATLLSLGHSVDEVTRLYLTLGREAFQPNRTWLGELGRMIGAKFDDKPLANLLKKQFGRRTLGSEDLKTGLVIITKRLDTGSVWALNNIPSQTYYEHNKDMRLWEIVRASTAAPTYFKPRRVRDVGMGESATFIDGGMSMHNNPSLKLFMTATLDGFGLKWATGQDKLLLISVGTGIVEHKAITKALSGQSNLALLPLLIYGFLDDSNELNETLLQWFSQSPTATTIDTQLGTLNNDLLGREAFLSYARYNTSLQESALKDLGLNLNQNELASLGGLDNVDALETLKEIGERDAKKVKPKHFPRSFDLE